MPTTVTINGITYDDVPRVRVPIYNGGGDLRSFWDCSSDTATASDIAEGKTAHGSSGLIVGTATGGGSTPVLQEKTVSPRRTQRIITPDTGYDGLSRVTIRGASLQDKTVNSSEESQYVTADDDYVGLNSVTINPYVLQLKTVYPSTSQQLIEADSGYDGLESVTIQPVSLQNIQVTPTDIQQVITPDSGYIGIGQVTVAASSGGTDTLGEAMTTNGLSQYVYTGSTYEKPKVNKLVLQNVTEIGTYAFEKDTVFSEVSAPNVTTVNSNAFRDDTVLKKVSLPSVTSFSTGVFIGCSSLEEIDTNIPPVGAQMFYNAGVNDSVNNKIDLDVTGYYNQMFQNSYVRNLTVRGNNFSSGSNMFSRMTVYGDFSMPNVTTFGSGSSQFSQCYFYGDVSMPNLTATTRNMFNGAYFYKHSITFENLQTIAQSTFNRANSIEAQGLVELTLPKVETIGSTAFSGCATLTDLYLPGTTMASLSSTVATIFSGCPIYTSSSARVHVNPDLVETYKTDSRWSAIADKIVAITS